MSKEHSLFPMGEEPNENEKKDQTEDLSFTVTEIEPTIVDPEMTEEVKKESVSTEEAPQKKKKKIWWIVLAALLALVLAILGTGIFLFYHYYQKMNIEKPKVHDADYRLLKLFDEESEEHYTFTIYLDGLTDAQVALVDDWYVFNRELIISVPKDPETMTEGEKVAFLQQILQKLKDLAETPVVQGVTIPLFCTRDGKTYSFVMQRTMVESDADYVTIMENAALWENNPIYLSFTGDPASMTDDEKTQLAKDIAAALRQMQKGQYIVKLIDSADGRVDYFAMYPEQLSEEQAKLVVNATELTLSDLPADTFALTGEEREELKERILAHLADAAIPRYTILLRDPTTQTEYAFVIKKTELAETQLAAIVKQIDRGMLDVELTEDPNLSADRAGVIDAVLAAIDRLENPPKTYQIGVHDRLSGNRYLIAFREDEVTDAQLVDLVSQIGLERDVSLVLTKAPADMDESEKQALIEMIVAEIRDPSQSLWIRDKETGTAYLLYFRSSDVSAEDLQYLRKQMLMSNYVGVAVSQNPDTMTNEQRAVLLRAVIDELKKPPALIYRMTVRDVTSGKAYVLSFTKDEVNDQTIFGYMLQQVYDGTALDMIVLSSPSDMTFEERKAFFYAVAEAVKNKKDETVDPEYEQQVQEHLQNMAQNPIQHTDHIYNVLLVGTDERSDNTTGARNSDTMMLLTVNYKDEKITLTSLLRDTYVTYKYMSGGKERENTAKLNTAYAIGGIHTLISAIESNYGVKIDNYVRVNWFSFVDVFEVLGGVNVDVNQKDLETLNAVISDTCACLGISADNKKLVVGGYQHLDAVQTLAYCRYRVSDADFGRTERQREVLTQVFQKFKSSSLSKITELLNTVLPMLTTDLSEGNCASLLIKFPSIAGFKVEQLRLPAYREYTEQGGSLIPDWDKTLRRLFKNTYGSLCPEQYK